MKDRGSVYHFPQLHKGDCFYDILSRYHEQSAHLNCRATSLELFGSTPDLRPSVTLPYRAGLIYTWLGPDSNISSEVLRDHHSAWQFLQLGGQFSSQELEPVIRAHAAPGYRKQARMIAVLQGSLAKLRYCPLCLLKDSVRETEPFWHQLHQIYGVKYCPVHRILLLNSDVTIEKRLIRYITASSILDEPGINEKIESAVISLRDDAYKDIYISLAETIEWLLEHGLELGDLDVLIRNYRESLETGRDYPITGADIACFIRELYDDAFLKEVLPGRIYYAITAETLNIDIKSFPPLLHAILITGLGGIQWLLHYST